MCVLQPSTMFLDVINESTESTHKRSSVGAHAFLGGRERDAHRTGRLVAMALAVPIILLSYFLTGKV